MTNPNDPLKAFFRSASEAANGPAGCPGADLLFRWSSGTVTDGEREALVQHAASCGACTDKIAMIEDLKARGFKEDELAAEFASRIQKEMRNRLRSARKPSDAGRRLWFAAFVTFMVLSFFVPQYFVQMLVLAMVAAAKWLLDTRARHVYVEILHRREREGEVGRGGAGSRLKGSEKLFE